MLLTFTIIYLQWFDFTEKKKRFEFYEDMKHYNRGAAVLILTLVRQKKCTFFC